MLTTRIIRLRPAEAGTIPLIGVAAAPVDTSTEKSTRHLLPPDQVPAHTPLLLLWRGEEISSPDVIIVKSAKRDEGAIALHLELRRFDGTLHANIISVPVVEVELGALEPGSYDVVVEVTNLLYRTLDHPEDAAIDSTRQITFSFEVV